VSKNFYVFLKNNNKVKITSLHNEFMKLNCLPLNFYKWVWLFYLSFIIKCLLFPLYSEETEAYKTIIWPRVHHQWQAEYWSSHAQIVSFRGDLALSSVIIFSNTFPDWLSNNCPPWPFPTHLPSQLCCGIFSLVLLYLK
jgi:hypothetical protein